MIQNGTPAHIFGYYSVMVEVEIPVKPFVRHYISKLYGTPARIPAKDPIGKFFYLLLSNQIHHRDHRSIRYKDTLKITVPSDHFHRKGFDLSTTSVIWLNNFVEGQIKKEMFLFVDFYTDHMGIQQKTAIELFMDHHGFTEESWPFETIKKAYSRRLKADGTQTPEEHLIRKYLGQMSPKTKTPNIQFHGKSSSHHRG